ncbi:N-acetylneuraminate synthase family protein [Algihabitans albus]|uniref:N-acetylneuraminate synthase family protein n=1 Tax=Algihabitans albus TaxID=2164067 RepID=UPI000E5C8D1B|nr:N-acetylneuraminate synthase family protein [Algihabitans albus]
MKIGPVDLTRDILVVAEIGNNHEGDLGRAEEMIHRAAEAGAQAVKFQTIDPERLVATDQTARLEQLRRFALTADDHARLAAVAAKAGVLFLSTPFSLEAVALLDPLVPAFKIASGDNDFAPLLTRVALTAKPLLISTGMSRPEEVALAVARIRTAWADAMLGDPGLVLLHCVSAYPTPVHAANLRAILSLSAYGAVPGYSDHTLGIEAAVLSVALGARVIEKHFTLSKTQSDFRDHQLSAEPQELAELVERVRGAEALLGDGVKRIQEEETPVAAAARRSICAARALTPGQIIGPQDLTWLRPAGGPRPGSEADLLGRGVKQPVPAGTPLTPELLD